MNVRRRLLLFLLTGALGLGLAVTVMTLAAQTSAVKAERVALPPAAPAQVDLEINKEGPEPNETLVEQPVTYTLYITNHLDTPINNVIITDTWLANIGGGELGIAPELIGSDYTADPADFAPESGFTYFPPTEDDRVGVMRWELIDPLPANFQGSIEFRLSVPAELQPLYVDREDDRVGPSGINNSAGIRGNGVTVNEDETVVTFIQGPVLTLTKSYTSDVGPRPGRLLTFTLHLRNLSTTQRADSVPATGLEVFEELPGELIYQGAWAEAPLAPGSPVYNQGERLITWTLAPTFTLYPGEMTVLTFAARLALDQEWKKTISNRDTDFGVTAAELANPVIGWETLSFKTLAIADKFYVTEPETQKSGTSGYAPLDPDKTYPNHLITYTVYVFNPLTRSLNNLQVLDIMPDTWIYTRTVDGPEPVTAPPITNSVAWEWADPPLEPEGVMSFTFVALVGPDTPIGETSCREIYYNSLQISADEFPVVYQYGEPFGDSRGMAELEVGNQIILSKDSDPGSQYTGALVTFTVNLHNQGNRAVHDIWVTDTMPLYFRYDGMLGGAPPPVQQQGNVLIWYVDQVAGQDEHSFSYQAVVDGNWSTDAYSTLTGRSPETTFCLEDRQAKVKILSPIGYQKSATPALDSGNWVVQGETVRYDVQYTNHSPLFDYSLLAFWDELPIVREVSRGNIENYDGFEFNGVPYYVYQFSPTFVLEHDAANDWQHSFVVTATGKGAGEDFCNALRIEEDAAAGKFTNQEIPQFGSSTAYTGTFGLVVTQVTGLPFFTFNTEEMAEIWLKPHVDLFQDVCPKTASFSGTVTVTLRLHNNMRGDLMRGVDHITLTYQMPDDFVFMEVITPTDPPMAEGLNGELVWYGLDLPEGEGQERVVQFLMQAPTERKTSKSIGYATAIAEDRDICIPHSEAQAKVEKGVEIGKVPNTPDVGPYGVLEYTLQLLNKTSVPVTQFIVTDTLPPGFEFVELVEGDYAPDEIMGEQVIWRGLRLEPYSEDGDTLTLRYKVRASGLVSVYYNLVDGFNATTYFTYGQRLDRYLEDVQVVVVAGVGMRKTVVPTYTLAGERVTYTLSIKNISNKQVAGIRVTDTLPTGFRFAGMVGSGATPVMTTPQVVWALGGELLPYQTTELVFEAAIDPELRSGVYYNNASATAHEAGDPDALITIPDTDKTAPVTVQGLPNVRRSKTVQPSQVQAGNLVTYTITLFNDTDAAQTVRLTDTLPLSLTYHSVIDGTPDPVRTSPVVWSGIDMAISETLTLTFRAQVDRYAPSGLYYNRLDAATVDLALTPRENLAPLQVEGIPRYDLQVSKSDGVINVSEGDVLRYTIDYANENAEGLTLQNVVITDTFSPGPPHVNPLRVGQDWTAVTTNTFVYTLGELAPGASGSVVFTLELASPIPQDILQISNTVRIDHATDVLAFESDLSNNVDSDLDTLRGPDLVVTGMTFAPTDPQTGQPIKIGVTVQNQGDDPTVNAAGDAWFPVELYVKGSDFDPGGPPSGVFDHAGGYCVDPGCSKTRSEYMIYAAGLAGGGAQATLSFTVILTQADDYALYAQVDPSFAGGGIGEPWGHSYGTVAEAIEDNNIYTYDGLMPVSESSYSSYLYLPLVLKVR